MGQGSGFSWATKKPEKHGGMNTILRHRWPQHWFDKNSSNYRKVNKLWGPSIPTDNIVRLLVDGREVYRHPTYRHPEYTIVKPEGKGYKAAVTADGKLVAQFKTAWISRNALDSLHGRPLGWENRNNNQIIKEQAPGNGGLSCFLATQW
jgi:hypothetical protein